MRFELSANIKLLSMNKAFITLKNGVRCRSKDYMIFSAAISRLLNENKKSFLDFNAYFDPFKHKIHAHLIQYTDELYTKDGRISQKSGDVGNMEKCITDCILVGSIDDSAITKWVLEKQYRDIKGFFVSFHILDK